MAHPISFRPRLLDTLKAGYHREHFAKDVGAGLTVGVVALPLAMAFAIASGLKPEAGLFTTVIAGFLISALGGARLQIGGPAGAFIVIVYGIVERYGLANLLIATAMSGVLLLLMGALKLGTLVRFIPVAVVIGFTNGIAVLIGLSQLKDFLGLSVTNMPADFFGMLKAIGSSVHTVNPVALALALLSLAVLLAWQLALPRWLSRSRAAPRWAQRLALLPGSIVALVLATLAVVLLNLPVETIGSRFGGVPSTLPSFDVPDLSWDSAKHLFAPTVTLALLGAIESLLCARVADGMTQDRHDPNQELMAQGVANVVTPFFGGMPATGTIARTVTNIKSGAVSPVAGMVHAGAVLLVILVAAPLAFHVPLAVLAAILMYVAWNMGEWREFANLRHFRLPYRVTLLAVFFLTVVFDLTVAVEVGLIAACLTFIYRVSNLTRREPAPLASFPELQGREAEIGAWRLYGALFFGAVKLVEDIEDRLPSRAVVLDLKNLIYVDSSGADALTILARACQRKGVRLIITGLDHQPRDIAQRTGLFELVGADNLAPELAAGIARALES